MLTRGYYACTKCYWIVTKGEVVWGLVALESLPQRETVRPPCSACKRGFEPELREEQFICPKCRCLLTLTDHVVRNDNTPEIMGTPYKLPIHSDALALTPENVAEHREKFPDIEIDDERRPVFTNAKQHQEYLDKCGIRKQAQKTGRSKGKIYSYPGSRCS